jgi:hypothetical protein
VNRAISDALLLVDAIGPHNPIEFLSRYFDAKARGASNVDQAFLILSKYTSAFCNLLSCIGKPMIFVLSFATSSCDSNQRAIREASWIAFSTMSQPQAGMQ